MFLCFMSQSQDPNLIQYDKQQTVSELHMDKIVLRAKWKYPDKKYELWYLNCVFLSHFSR